MQNIKVEKYNKDKHYKSVMQMSLRRADAQELKASTGSDDNLNLIKAAEASDIVCYVYLCNKQIIAISGASYTSESEIAGVWAMGSEEVLKYWDEVEPLFTKHVNAVLDVPGIKVIGNAIDLRNKAHIRWIKKLGFTLTGVTVKLGGYDFESFYKRRD